MADIGGLGQTAGIELDTGASEDLFPGLTAVSNSLGDKIQNYRAQALSTGTADPMAGTGVPELLRQYYEQASKQGTQANAAVNTATPIMQQARDAYVQQLQNNAGPAMDQARSAQMLGKMGAALMQPVGIKDGAIGSPWANMTGVGVDTSITNAQSALEAQNKLKEAQYLFGKEDYTNAVTQQTAAQKRQEEAIKNYIDWQKALKTAEGSKGDLYNTLKAMGYTEGSQEWNDMARMLYPMAHGSELGKAMTAKHPELKLGTPEYAAAAKAEGIKAELRERVYNMYFGPQSAELQASYKKRYGDNYMEYLVADHDKQINAFEHASDKAVAAPTASGKKPAEQPSAEVILATKETQAKQPARNAVQQGVLEQELKDETVRRDSLPPGPERDAANRNIGLINTQLGNKSNTPPPMRTPEEKLKAEKAAGVVGEEQGKAQINLPDALNAAENGQKLLAKLQAHSGKAWRVGLAANLPVIEGTSQKGFDALLEQVKSKAFLEAFKGLRGAGAITEKEGEKATAAITRLAAGLPEADFDEAVEELRAMLAKGVETAKLKAKDVTATSQQQTATHPDIPEGAVFVGYAKGTKNPVYKLKDGSQVVVK